MKKIIFMISIIFWAGSVRMFCQTLLNGDFDSGPLSGWTQYSAGGYGLIGTSTFLAYSDIQPTVTPHSGNYMARLGGFNYEQNYIKQTVTLPNVNPLYLSLYYQTWAFSGAECSGPWTGGEIKVVVGGQTILDNLLCYSNRVTDWTFGYFNLTPLAGQTVEIKISEDAAGEGWWSFLYLDDIALTSILDVKNTSRILSPSEYKLEQNFPNPFNPETNIKYSVPFESNIKITITNVIGETIKELVNDHQQAGNYIKTFNSPGLSSGIYFYSISASSVDGKKTFNSTKKMILLK